MKQAQYWSLISGSGPVTPDLLDSDGYPLATIGSGINTVFFVPTQTDRPGRYAITWDGNGTIYTGMSLSSATGSKTSSSGSGRYEFLPGTTDFIVGIATVGSPRITNMKVFHVDDEASLNAGEVFSSYFKNKIRTSNIGVIRFLGWGGGGDGYNISNIATWAMRRPQSYVFYDGHEIRSGNYAGTTSLSGQAYSVGAPPDGFTLTDKAWVHALIGQSYPAIPATFTNGSANVGIAAHGVSVNSTLVLSENVAGSLPAGFSVLTLYHVVSVPDPDTVTLSATQGGSAIVAGSAGSGSFDATAQLTLNVDGTGAKRILNENSSFICPFSNSNPVSGSYRSLATFVYDAALDAYIKYGGDLAFDSFGLMNGVPPELMVRLCAEVGAHPWIIIPYLALDPVTDYVPEMISYVKNYPGASWMAPRFEASNEVWNFGSHFFVTGYATAKAAANWSGASYMDWYGKVVSTLGQTAANIYGGGLGTSYHVMLGVQTHNVPASNADERAASSKYVAQAAAAQSLTWRLGTITYTKSAASGWVSHVAPANYITPSEYGSGTETTRAAAFAGVRFVGSINSGTLTVSQIDTPGGTLAIGKTIFGRGIAGGVLQSGVTITGGSAPTWTLSSPITLAEDTFYAGSDMTQPGLYVDSLAGAAADFNLALVKQRYDSWASWAAGFGISKMAPYEGGFSPDISAFASAGQTELLRLAGKLVASSPGSATGLQGYTYGNSPSNYGNLVAAGGEFPSLFLITGKYPMDNAWSVLDDIYQPDPPQLKAVKAFQ